MEDGKNNVDGINYNDVKRYAKITGVNVIGKKKAIAVEMVLDGIIAHYTPAKEELSQEDFEEYKRVNSDMLDWFNKHKEYEAPAEQEDPEDPEPEDQVEPKAHKSEDDQGEPEQEEEESDTVEEDIVAAEEAEKVVEEETKKGPEEAKAKADAKKAKKGKDKGKGKKGLAETKDRIKDAKAEAKKKKAEAKTTSSRQFEKDEFGFVVGSKKSLFAKAISEKPRTMFEIKKMDWNDRMAGFYDTFKELQEKGLADRDDKGKMSMKKAKK